MEVLMDPFHSNSCESGRWGFFLYFDIETNSTYWTLSGWTIPATETEVNRTRTKAEHRRDRMEGGHPYHVKSETVFISGV